MLPALCVKQLVSHSSSGPVDQVELNHCKINI